MKVCKFGGSSLCDAKQFHKVYEIIKSDPSRRYVIVSAPGKRFADDMKITDSLHKCCEKVVNGKTADYIFDEICARFTSIIEDLGLKLSLEKEYETIRESLTTEFNRDYIVSRGEYLCGRIMADYLGYDFIDAASVIAFNADNSLDFQKTNSRISEITKEHQYAVIPGFYGSNDNKKVITFPRGGSDITGALVAKAAYADLYENWTDVSGFLMASPTLISNAGKVDYMCYRELLQLCKFGAQVFHTDAITPLCETDIPTHIRNTNSPKQTGTMIYRELPPAFRNKSFVCGITVEDTDLNSTDDTVLLHLIGYDLSSVRSTAVQALHNASIESLLIKEYTNDIVFRIKRQQITEAAAAVYTALI